jgi:hypothetical protein
LRAAPWVNGSEIDVVGWAAVVAANPVGLDLHLIEDEAVVLQDVLKRARMMMDAAVAPAGSWGSAPRWHGFSFSRWECSASRVRLVNVRTVRRDASGGPC